MFIRAFEAGFNVFLTLQPLVAIHYLDVSEVLVSVFFVNLQYRKCKFHAAHYYVRIGAMYFDYYFNFICLTSLYININHLKNCFSKLKCIVTLYREWMMARNP